MKGNDETLTGGFLPDSYTRYRNRIGLSDGTGAPLSALGQVELVFPYKDCVLAGGQTKDEQRRREVFYHETLDADKIDRLLWPKALGGALRYTSSGPRPAEGLEAGESLILRGNNLLVLASLQRRYGGKVRCIYIDPPYNTGKRSSFGYNDSFSHSSWLTFMKNRLELAYRLLSPDGVILIQTDDGEQAYLKVLCDDLFGREQFVGSLFVQVRYPNKTLAEDGRLHKVVETIHIYAKDHRRLRINYPRADYDLSKFCWQVRETGDFSTVQIAGRRVDIFPEGTYAVQRREPGPDGLKETWATGSLIRQGGTAAAFLAEHLIPRRDTDGLKTLYKVYGMGEDGLGYRYILGPRRESAFRGKFYSGVPTAIRADVAAGRYRRETPLPNFLDFAGAFGNCRGEGGVDIGGGKKPEALLKFLLETFSDEGDTVLDFFLGSGTTAAVAHKLGRTYIGVEQLDYGENDAVRRMQNVIAGDRTGISPQVGWTGGGSFVYCELIKCNQRFIEEIQGARGAEALEAIYGALLETGFLSAPVSVSEIRATAGDFHALTVGQKRRFLLELVDKNLLYVNLCDLDDADYRVAEADKIFTRQFYGED